MIYIEEMNVGFIGDQDGYEPWDDVSNNFLGILTDPIVKDQGRMNMVSSSPTPIAGSGPVGE